MISRVLADTAAIVGAASTAKRAQELRLGEAQADLGRALGAVTEYLRLFSRRSDSHRLDGSGYAGRCAASAGEWRDARGDCLRPGSG